MTLLSSAAVRRFRAQFNSMSGAFPIMVRIGTVASVSPGTAADGGSQVTVNVNGASIVAPYLNTPPSSGSTVAVLLVYGSPLILGMVKGLPSF